MSIRFWLVLILILQIQVSMSQATDFKQNPETGVIIGAEAETLPGSGKNAVLLVHGFLGSRIDFHDLPQMLVDKGLTVRMIRLPGHASRPREMATMNEKELITEVRKEFDALKADYPRVGVIGFSMGGTLSTLLAADREIDRLVLVAPCYGVTQRWYYGMKVETWNRLAAPVIPYVWKPDLFVQVNSPGVRGDIFCYKWISLRASAELIRMAQATKTPAILGQVKCPLLVLHSKGDRAASPAATEEAFPLFGSQDKKIVWYERSNHHLLWDYEEVEVKAQILDFMKPLY